jgi:DNA polymerase-3 subunit epsilon
LFDLIYHKDPNHLSTFIQQEVNPKSVHPNLNIEIIDELPNKAGIYKFLNEFNQIIYIGKSIHIKKRVEQHLRNTATAKGTKMIQEIASVEYELTGSELIAMLLESELIKVHQPIFNRKLRKSIFPFGLYDESDANGYINLSIQSIAKNNNEPLPFQFNENNNISNLDNDDNDEVDNDEIDNDNDNMSDQMSDEGSDIDLDNFEMSLNE